MQTITLKPLQHRGAEYIGIYFENYSSLNTIIRKQATAKWSQTKKCWYIPYTQKHYSLLQTALKEKAILNIDELKKYTAERKKEKQTKDLTSQSEFAARKIEVASGKNLPKQRMLSSPLLGREPVPIYREARLANRSLSVGWGEAVNKHVLPAMKQHLVLKGYSPSTIKTYMNEMGIFLKAIKQHPADEFTAARLKDYLQYCYEVLKLTENTLHSRMNALKFYYEQVLKKEKFFWEIPRPKKQLLLPKIFNQDEIAAIINSVTNKKHKTMLMLAYSAGLRVSEVIALKVYNIDSKRMSILIEQGKGKKDRLVSLSPVLLVMMRDYVLQYKPDRRGFLFEGNNKGTPYSTRSLQEVLQAAKKKAGVLRPGSIHSLRHSFATHLIEKGTDVTMIQKLLGHNDLRTTLLYLHTSNKDLLKIISPLDDLSLI
jgi:integrase/recombinase XerD